VYYGQEFRKMLLDGFFKEEFDTIGALLSGLGRTDIEFTETNARIAIASYSQAFDVPRFQLMGLQLLAELEWLVHNAAPSALQVICEECSVPVAEGADLRKIFTVMRDEVQRQFDRRWATTEVTSGSSVFSGV